jgi:hypothetical protein
MADTKRKGRPPGSKASVPNKPGAGRPKGTTSPKAKGVQLAVRCTPDEKAWAEQQAKRDGVSLSEWQRIQLGLDVRCTNCLKHHPAYEGEWCSPCEQALAEKLNTEYLSR